MPQLAPLLTAGLVIAGALCFGYLTYMIAIKEAQEKIEKAFKDKKDSLRHDHIRYVSKAIANIEDKR